MSDSIYPEPPAGLRTISVRKMAQFVGPGAIIASVTIGSGELVWASRSGAIFGYAMLWCFLYAGVFKGIQVYVAARYFTLTGEHPMVGWRNLPGPRCWFPLLIALPAVGIMPIAFSGIPEMLGGFLHRLSGADVSMPSGGLWTGLEMRINLWTTAVLCLCLTLALLSTETILERASMVVLALIVACVALAVIRLGPSLLSVLQGSTVPRMPVFPDFVHREPYAREFSGRSPWLELSLYFTAVGGGAYDYIGYVGLLRTRQWGLAGRRAASRGELDEAVAADQPAAAETVRRAQQWARAPLLDTSVSFFFVVLVTLLFGVLGTLLLHAREVVPANNNLLNEQEVFLKLLHPELRWVYRAGVLLAFVGTLYGAFEIYQHTFVESVSAVFTNCMNAARRQWIRRATVVYCFVGGLLMVWLPERFSGSIVDRMTFASIISGATSCGLWCFAMLWLDRVRLPRPLRMSRSLQALTWLAGTGMTLLGVQTILAYLEIIS